MADKKKAVPPFQNIVQICKQITILIFYQVTHRVVIHLKLIYSSVQV
jgi:hypothetical protein